ncbi:aldo/keto reductase [Sphingomonas sp. KC8]|uniref:aldo/keto reductase n=1 Tax=Sphingomonas sp. KC8 TaxID=1030157 RepID=UPI0002488A07|nr:aldo/keto reductase [Sphingomonas sp. KC8]ARS28267.1 oxidoreductase [Sphingomonas sp. KC8]
MEQRRLGRSDLQVSVVGLGCNNFGWKADLAETQAIVDRALDAGISFFDTAISYGPSEEYLGTALGVRRKDAVIATKFGSPEDPVAGDARGARAYVMDAAEASLRRLNTDWIDLYQLHFPDPATPIDETLRALQDLVAQGKVRAIGCSNLSANAIDAAQTAAKDAGIGGFVTTQNEYNVLVRGLEQDLAPMIARHGLGLLPYFPLANGVLTGKYKTGRAAPADARLADAPVYFDAYRDPAKWEAAARLEAFAAARGHSLLDLAVSWLAARPGVTSVIAGVSRASQVDANARAADWVLSAEDMAEIDRLLDAA